jgi:NAD(P)-dependent dehydrogenase (short-subunit alcohol dehydrogenase family)
MNGILQGKVALVTGGSKGIGRQLAIGLAVAGAKIGLVYKTDQAGGEMTCELIQARGGHAKAFEADVGRREEMEEVVRATAGYFGTLHILINNAARTRFGPLDEVTDDDFDDLVNTNLRGPFFGSIAAGKIMKESKTVGTIINISSCAAKLMLPFHSCYTMVKGGLEALTRQLAFEMAPHVRVNCIAPGATSTERNQGYDLQFDEKWSAVTPAGRVAQVEDYVGPCVFLASDHSRFMTGQILNVDGGWTLKGENPEMAGYDLSAERTRG